MQFFVPKIVKTSNHSSQTDYSFTLVDLPTLLHLLIPFSHNIDVILNTLSQIKTNKTGCIIHFDREALYSSFQYIQKLKQLGIIRSISETGKSTQNVPVESFFDHFKDEVNYKKCNNFEEIKRKRQIRVLLQ